LAIERAVQAVARKRIEQLNENVKPNLYVPAMDFARYYARLDDREQTLAWLEKAAEERYGLVYYFIQDPVFDDVRSEPRFQKRIEENRPRPLTRFHKRGPVSSWKAAPSQNSS
jgi:hypothetical protein